MTPSRPLASLPSALEGGCSPRGTSTYDASLRLIVESFSKCLISTVVRPIDSIAAYAKQAKMRAAASFCSEVLISFNRGSSKYWFLPTIKIYLCPWLIKATFGLVRIKNVSRTGYEGQTPLRLASTWTSRPSVLCLAFLNRPSQPSGSRETASVSMDVGSLKRLLPTRDAGAKNQDVVRQQADVHSSCYTQEC